MRSLVAFLILGSYILMALASKLSFLLHSGHRPSNFLMMSWGDFKILFSYSIWLHSAHVTFCGKRTSPKPSEGHDLNSYPRRANLLRRQGVKLYSIRARIDVSETLSERLVQQVKMRLDERPMSLKELVEQTKVEQKQVYRVLSSLHRSNRIVQFRDPDGVRRYRFSEESS